MNICIDKPHIHKAVTGIYWCEQIFIKEGVRVTGRGKTPKDAYLSFLNEGLKYFNRRKVTQL